MNTTTVPQPDGSASLASARAWFGLWVLMPSDE